jgi:hypothetical protein
MFQDWVKNGNDSSRVFVDAKPPRLSYGSYCSYLGGRERGAGAAASGAADCA